jgi:hypothetical protein
MACAILFSIAGCDRGKKTAKAPYKPLTLAAAESSPRANATAETITMAEAEAFAAKWVQAISTNDAVAAGQLVDFKEIFGRSLEGLVDDEQFRRGFLEGSSTAASNFVQSISPFISREGNYELVRAVYRDGQAHVVLRLFDDEGRLNYHDLRLVRNGGEVYADELFIAATGEAFSDTLRVVVGAAAQSQISTMGRISGQAQAEMDRLKSQTAISQAIQSGNPAEALRLYNALPEDMKKYKTMMLYRISATPIEDEPAYLAAVEDYVIAFPEDASVGLISMDVAVMRKDPEMLARAHHAMTSWTGGDPLLDLMIAANLANLGEIEQAKGIVADVDVDASSLLEAQDFAATVGLASENHDEVLKRLRVMRDRFGLEFGDLRETEGFEKFVKSEQFEQWNRDGQ